VLPLALLVALAVLAIGSSGSTAAAASGGGGGGKVRRDTAPPSIVISTPAAGAAVTGTVAVTGTANDNVRVSTVAVSVDGGSYATASGTSSWSYTVDASGYTAGSHTLSARATDTSGNSTTVSVGFTVVVPDTIPPTISITAPVAGTTVVGTVTVTGNASDNQALADVALSIDGGPYQAASGGSSWSLAFSTTSFANGSHRLTARAVDAAGNQTLTTDTVSFANPVVDTTPPTVSFTTPAAGANVGGTVLVSGVAKDDVSVAKVELSVDGGAYQTASGSSNWSSSLDTSSLANGSHTLVARATDSSGNQATTSEQITVSNPTTAPTSPYRETLVTPEGVTIDIGSDVTGWTAAQVYQLLQANAYQLNVVGPDLTVIVQTQYATVTSIGVSKVNGVYQNYQATIYLQATANSVFTARPDYAVAHEYGHAWSTYWLDMKQNGDWSAWLNYRGLTGNLLLDSSLSWDRSEMIADDYRLLFGSPAAISEAAYINPAVADPRTVPGLRDFFVTTWA
jgi:hypothetical protein